MQDVTIKAPKATISVPQVLSWLSVLNAIKDMLASQKVVIPGAIADAISAVNNVATAITAGGGATMPGNLDAMLSDLLVVLKSVEVTTNSSVINAGINDVIAAVTWTKAGIEDVHSGQFATMASSKISIGGVEVPIALLACRTDQGNAAEAAGFQAPSGAAKIYTQDDLDAQQAQQSVLEAQVASLQGELDAAKARIAALTSPPPTGPTEQTAPAQAPPAAEAPPAP